MKYISTIAKYEAKTLFRSWFFKIFAIISILLITFANIGFFSPIGDNQWAMRGISSFIPQINLLYFNLFQSIIAIFIASDFMKRDKNQDTAQVFYIRPMSNMEYVLGKLFGVLKVFVLFNLLIVVLSLVFNLIAEDTSINLLAYLYYFLLISLPSLLFILGFSFFLMSLVKNQAITYLILFGYVGGSLFGFGNLQGQVWDYMAFYLPMTYSDLIGFTNLDKILLQRGSFLFLGLFFTALTILMLNRLPQSKGHTILTYCIGAISFVIASAGLYSQLNTYYSDNDRRQEAISLNDHYFHHPFFTVNNYNIDLKHYGKEIEAKTVIRGRVSASASDTIVFSLNEGLVVEQVLVNDHNVAFERKKHLLLIPGEFFDRRRSEVEIDYKGSIDQTLCYLDIEDYREERMVGILRVPQEYAVVHPNFLLLTTESLWYPLAGVTHTRLSPAWESFNFSSYDLKVKSSDSLVVISQGKEKVLEDGSYHFKTDKALPRISVTAGHFEKRSMLIDSVLPINLYHKKGHNYYTAYLDSILDTIPALTAEILGDFERNIGLYYPYTSFNVVEVPIQFTSHTHLWAQTTDNTQPMITLIPEKGVGLQALDFKNNMRFSRSRDDKNKTLSDKQMESYKVFVQQTFFNTTSRVNSANSRRSSYNGTVSSAYSIFPSFHYFSNHIASKEFALLNVVLESYYYTLFSDGRDAVRSAFRGSAEANHAAKLFEEMSFEEFLQIDSLNHLFADAINMKGKYLFSLLESNELDITLDETLEEFLGNTERRLADFDEFSSVVKKNLAVDFPEVWNKWKVDKGIPSFITSQPTYYTFRDVDAKIFQVLWKVQNISETDGVVTFTFRTRRGGSRGRAPSMGSSDAETVKALIPAGKTYELAKIFYDQPGMMMLDFNVTQNLPSTQMFFTRDIKTRKNVEAIEYEYLSDKPIVLYEEDEIIVDNEDDGFTKVDQIRGGLIKNWLNKKDEEITYQQGRSAGTNATKWLPFVDTRYFGTSIKSAYVVEKGNGGQTAEWKAVLDSSAYYNVYVYIGQPNEDRSRRPGQGGGGGGGGGGNQNSGNNEKQQERLWQYYVSHPSEKEEVMFDLNQASAGWNLLGTYYFENTDTARVMLTNLTKERRVVADAVKWVIE